MEDKKVKYGFGLSETECFSDMFDSIDELIAFAQDAYEHPDGNYLDEDLDDYPDVIWVGIIEEVNVTQFAPSLDDIADQITDQFYCEHNVDDDDVCHIHDAISSLVYEHAIYETKKIAIEVVNKLLYDIAKDNGISLYELCFHTTVEYSYPEGDLKDNCNCLNKTLSAQVKIVPVEFDLTHDDDYWRDRYLKFKAKIRELVNIDEDES